RVAGPVQCDNPRTRDGAGARNGSPLPSPWHPPGTHCCLIDPPWEPAKLRLVTRSDSNATNSRRAWLMGVALYHVLEEQGLDPWETIDCKRLARAADELSRLAKTMSLPDLWYFYSNCRGESDEWAEWQARSETGPWIGRLFNRLAGLHRPPSQHWFSA